MFKLHSFYFSLVLLALIFFSGTSCTKVSPEDPWISFRSRTNRITNNWKLEKLLNDGNEVQNSDITQIDLEISDVLDDYTWKTTYKDGSSTEETGKWEINSSDNREIIFKPDFSLTAPDQEDRVFYLHRVSHKELWLRQLTGIICDHADEFKFKSN